MVNTHTILTILQMCHLKNKSAVAGFWPTTESNLWTAPSVVSVKSSIIAQYANCLKRRLQICVGVLGICTDQKRVTAQFGY